jgi:K+ transporter
MSGRGRLQIRNTFPESRLVSRIHRSCELSDPHLAHLRLRLGATTFFVGRETLIPSEKPGMARWRRRLFAVMHGNAQMAAEYFRLPPNRVVELGQVVEL